MANAEVQVSATLVEELVRSQHPISSEAESEGCRQDSTTRSGDSAMNWWSGCPGASSGEVDRERTAMVTRVGTTTTTVDSNARPRGPSSDAFPWSWTIAKWIEGTPGNEADPRALSGAATLLGHFLKALHHDAPADAPINEFRSGPLVSHDVSFQGRLDHVGAAIDRDPVLAIWRTSLDAEPWVGAPQWIHEIRTRRT